MDAQSFATTVEQHEYRVTDGIEQEDIARRMSTLINLDPLEEDVEKLPQVADEPPENAENSDLSGEEVQEETSRAQSQATPKELATMRGLEAGLEPCLQCF